MAGSERDISGFSSGGDEDDMSGLHSPSASEDSVEVQVMPISLRNKRKLAEPRKIQEPSTAPLKKRRFDRMKEIAITDEETRQTVSLSPFRPWSNTCKNSNIPKTTAATSTITSTATAIVSNSTTPSTALSKTTAVPSSEINAEYHPEEERRKHEELQNQEEALQRLQESDSRSQAHIRSCVSPRRPSSRHQFETMSSGTSISTSISPSHPRLQDEPLSLVTRDETPRVPSHPGVSGTYERTPTYLIDHTPTSSSSPPRHHHHHHHDATAISQARHHHQQGGQQRNYKNMTRERRIEANARERTRVHTISAAFDTLRRAIPAYSHNQKLSKLSVLRIACSYIMTLSKIVSTPEGESTNSPALGACVDLVSKTIQTEGKLRKRKDD